VPTFAALRAIQTVTAGLLLFAGLSAWAVTLEFQNVDGKRTKDCWSYIDGSFTIWGVESMFDLVDEEVYFVTLDIVQSSACPEHDIGPIHLNAMAVALGAYYPVSNYAQWYLRFLENFALDFYGETDCGEPGWHTGVEVTIDPGESFPQKVNYAPGPCNNTGEFTLAPDPVVNVYADPNGNDVTDVVDVQCTILAALASQQGGEAPACVAGPACLADLDCNGSVDVADVQLVTVLVLGSSLPILVDADQDGIVDGCQDTLACAP
jgi:hypothetical protein